MHNQWLSPGFLLWPTWKQNKIDNDIDNLFGPKSLYKKLYIYIYIKLNLKIVFLEKYTVKRNFFKVYAMSKLMISSKKRLCTGLAASFCL